MGKYLISVVGVVTHDLVSGETSATLGIDLASLRAAPSDAFGWLYDDLLNGMAGVLKLLELRLHAAQPMLIVGLEVLVD